MVTIRFGKLELILIHSDFQRWDTAANATVTAYTEAYALCLRAKLDLEQGWYKTLSNVAVKGATGIKQDIY